MADIKEQTKIGRLLSSIIATILIMSILSGTGILDKIFRLHKKIYLHPSISIESIINILSDESIVDDYFKENNLEYLFYEYQTSRELEDIENLNRIIYSLGLNILKANISEALIKQYIETNDKIDYNVSELSNYYKGTYDQFTLTGESKQILNFINKSKNYEIKTIKEADEVISIYKEFLLTSGKIEDNIIDFKEDPEKTKLLELHYNS